MDTSAPSRLNMTRQAESGGMSSSQEETEESESEPERRDIRTVDYATQAAISHPANAIMSSDDDENRTAINQPLSRGSNFMPRPNAFNHPSAHHARTASQPIPGSYFPASRPQTAMRRRYSRPQSDVRRPSHLPHNILSPGYNVAIEHDEALRASLNSLLSVAAAARGHSKPEDKRASPPVIAAPSPRRNQIDPSSLRLVPQSALPTAAQAQHQHEPTFQPTIRRRHSITSISTSSEQQAQQHKQSPAPEHKRKSSTSRNTSRERRALKKTRSIVAPGEEVIISPTMMTWLVSAGVVVILSALSFGAGYSMGREAGLLEGQGLAGDGQLRACAQDAGRSSLGLRRSLARTAIQA
jgi:hypothetical protein